MDKLNAGFVWLKTQVSTASKKLFYGIYWVINFFLLTCVAIYKSVGLLCGAFRKMPKLFRQAWSLHND